MRFITSPQILVESLLALSAAIVPLHANSIPITYELAGPATVVGSTDTTLTLAAAAAGSFLSGDPVLDASWNPVTYADLSVLNLNTGLLNGAFTLTFGDGDTLVGNVFENDSAVDASPTQTGPFSQTLTFTGGTGEFAGATGSLSGEGFVGLVDFSVSGTGSVDVATPEPTAGTLLFGGLALFIAGAWRSGVRRGLERRRCKT